MTIFWAWPGNITVHVQVGMLSVSLIFPLQVSWTDQGIRQTL